MTEDLESRIKALEEQLIPNPDKMSTMKATNRLKQYLDGLKKGTQEEAVWWLIDEAEKVPALEKKLSEKDNELKAKIAVILKANAEIRQETEAKMKELVNENTKLKTRVAELEKNEV